MTPRRRGFALLLALGCRAGSGMAQPAGNARPETLITTQFVIPMTHQAALARLDAYYQEQVGRTAEVVVPEIGPNRHFEVWREIWMFFEPADQRTMVVLKRPGDPVTSRLVKSWMVELAGRLGTDAPLAFKEEPPLRSVDGEVCASRKDLTAALESATMRPITSWRHAGLLVSAAPLAEAVLAPADLHGIHRLTVTAQTAVAARQMMAKLIQAANRPELCAAVSEMAELDAEIRKAAQTKADDLSNAASQAMYPPKIDLQLVEDRLRGAPEMQKRIAAAKGYYDVKYRVQKTYRKVTISWSELSGYSRDTGRSQGERPLGRTSLPNVKPAAGTGNHLTARSRMEPLQPGAYHVRLEGESLTGEVSKIDECIYWFDGKTFEEI
jgi:hypothetical protein